MEDVGLRCGSSEAEICPSTFANAAVSQSQNKGRVATEDISQRGREQVGNIEQCTANSDAAMLSEEVAMALLDMRPLRVQLESALQVALPGVSCLSVSLTTNGGKQLEQHLVVEAGSIRMRCGPTIPVLPHSAHWHVFTTGNTLIARDNIHSKSYSDWTTLHKRFGAVAFVTCPLEVAAGVMGVLSAAGGSELDVPSVLCFTARLAESLLRRATDSLVKEAVKMLQASGNAEKASQIMTRGPLAANRGNGLAPVVDLQYGSSRPPLLPVHVQQEAEPAPEEANMPQIAGSAHASGAQQGPAPPPVIVSPFLPATVVASERVAANLESNNLRKSSLEQYQELRYYCLSCRKENLVDLPTWHWGQMVDSLCTSSGRSGERSGRLATATAPAAASSPGPLGPNPAPGNPTAGSGLNRMARLAALCAGREDCRRADFGSVSLQASSTSDLSHPVAQRAASGQLTRISAQALSESSTSSQHSSRSPSFCGQSANQPSSHHGAWLQSNDGSSSSLRTQSATVHKGVASLRGAASSRGASSLQQGSLPNLRPYNALNPIGGSFKEVDATQPAIQTTRTKQSPLRAHMQPAHSPFASVPAGEQLQSGWRPPLRDSSSSNVTQSHNSADQYVGGSVIKDGDGRTTQASGHQTPSLTGSVAPNASEDGDARAAVTSYLDGLRSRSNAARVSRASSSASLNNGTPAAMARAAESRFSGSGTPYRNRRSSDQSSGLEAISPGYDVGVGPCGPTITSPHKRAQAHAKASSSSSGGLDDVVANYMQSLRRHSVAAAAAEAARQAASQSRSDEESGKSTSDVAMVPSHLSTAGEIFRRGYHSAQHAGKPLTWQGPQHTMSGSGNMSGKDASNALPSQAYPMSWATQDDLHVARSAAEPYADKLQTRSVTLGATSTPRSRPPAIFQGDSNVSFSTGHALRSASPSMAADAMEVDHTRAALKRPSTTEEDEDGDTLPRHKHPAIGASDEQGDTEAHQAVATYMRSLRQTSIAAVAGRAANQDTSSSHSSQTSAASPQRSTRACVSASGELRTRPHDDKSLHLLGQACSPQGGGSPQSAQAEGTVQPGSQPGGAVSAYLAALNQRRASAAAAAVTVKRQEQPGRSDGVAHVSSYMAALKSRSAQAAAIRAASAYSPSSAGFPEHSRADWSSSSPSTRTSSRTSHLISTSPAAALAPNMLNERSARLVAELAQSSEIEGPDNGPPPRSRLSRSSVKMDTESIASEGNEGLPLSASCDVDNALPPS